MSDPHADAMNNPLPEGERMSEGLLPCECLDGNQEGLCSCESRCVTLCQKCGMVYVETKSETFLHRPTAANDGEGQYACVSSKPYERPTHGIFTCIPVANDGELARKIRNALCDPNAPWYGSDLVEWVDDYMKAQAAEVEKLRGLAQVLIDSYPADDSWWCPHCGTTDCTFEGLCAKCGCKIENVQADSLIAGLIAALDAPEKGE